MYNNNENLIDDIEYQNKLKKLHLLDAKINESYSIQEKNKSITELFQLASFISKTLIVLKIMELAFILFIVLSIIKK